jgi:hypothetical protein
MESGLHGSPRSDGFADVYYLCHKVNKEYKGGIRLHPLFKVYSLCYKVDKATTLI